MINSFLMAGQSNMAGRGFLKDVGQIYDEQIKMLVNGRWQTMTEPINFDRPTSGASLAAAFAAAWRLENSGQIGLIPCAEGGASLDEWAVGGVLFENAIFQAKLAQRTSTLSGILWHQGENDSFGGRHTEYYERLSVIVSAFRTTLNTPDLPFVMGGLGNYLSDGRYGKYFTEYEQINAALIKVSINVPNCYFVTAKDLTANPDGLHFDAVSLRKFGLRYFAAYSNHSSLLEPLPDELEASLRLSEREMTKTEKAALLEISFGRGELSLAELEKQMDIINALS
ncbi:sialate O-acetylesterase [Pedobacter nototheniae]|uniref:sialate O-acetylesterase n=1 Tax=Pedobacter nototheniae TaxID=2488994 RepID=UPI001038679C|nr:sialate O-acetylesterase [Pedobacter nototheniae]